jgi:hypothetical protein
MRGVKFDKKRIKTSGRTDLTKTFGLLGPKEKSVGPCRTARFEAWWPLTKTIVFQLSP